MTIPTTSTVAQYISHHLALCGKTQEEVAAEVGFRKSNMIAMIKCGRTRLPSKRVAAMAKALGVDPYDLCSRVMKEYQPGVWSMLESQIMKQPVLTKREIALVLASRVSAGRTSPHA